MAATAALILAATLALGGCGSTTPAAKAGPTPDSAAVEPNAYPVTIPGEFGDTTITSKPKRVVVVGLVEQDALLALGTVPLAVTEWFGNAPGRIFDWAKPALGKAAVPEVLPAETNFEKIAALKPDLIVALYAGLKAKDYTMLTAIAPTLTHPKGQNDYSISWQEVTQTVGAALGRPKAAQKLVEGVDDKFAATRKKYPQFEGKRAVMATLYEGIFVYAPEDPRGRLLDQLGFTLPADLADLTKNGFGKSISAEDADKVDVDAVVWLSSEADVRKAVPTYAGLRAAKQGRSVFVPEDNDDPFYIATSFVTVLSLPYLLDRLAPRLAAAVDGDPATVAN